MKIRQRPTLPEGLPSSTIGAEGLNFCVRNGYRCFPFAIVTGIYSFRCRIPHPEACSFFCFFYYAYPAAFPAVSFASSSDSLMYCIHWCGCYCFLPPSFSLHPQNCIMPYQLWSSPRPISIRQLNASLHLHPGPIYLVFCEGPYYLPGMGNLILRGASRLDAFSVYPFRTWLLSCATGVTTDSPSVRPSRSSRTRDSSSQISCARDG